MKDSEKTEFNLKKKDKDEVLEEKNIFTREYLSIKLDLFITHVNSAVK